MMGLVRWFLAGWLLSTIGIADIDSNRPDLDDLVDEDEFHWDQYELPYLFTQRGSVIALTVEQVTNRVRAHLRKTALPIAGSLEPSTDGKVLSVPKDVLSGDQLQAIEQCNPKHCMMKLNTKVEKTVMARSKNKSAAYQELIQKRLANYLQHRKLLGYEERDDNTPSITKMLGTFPYLEKFYPACQEFLKRQFWKREKGSCLPVSSFLRSDVSVMMPDKVQPTWRVSEVFEFKVGDKHLFFEIHIYSNHYNDSSVRSYEVFTVPGTKRTALVLTDILENDTLTISGVVRLLYTGKIESAISQYQKDEMKRILDRNS